MKVAGKILGYVLTSFLVLLIAVSAFLAISARRSKDRISTVGGYKVLTVLSGSMEPVIKTGDAIIVRPLGPGELPKDGDVITFQSTKEKDGKPMLITHRVGGVVSVNGKPAAWVTKGDANQAPDPETVALGQIVGVYRWRIPYLGYMADWGRTPVGIICLVVIPGVLVIAEEVIKMVRTVKEEEAKEEAKKAAAQ